MSAPNERDEPNAEVIPLRASDAGTEAHLSEERAPAYTVLEDSRAQRRPIIPEHWRTREVGRESLHGYGALRSLSGRLSAALRTPRNRPDAGSRIWERRVRNACLSRHACWSAHRVPVGRVRGGPPRWRVPD